MAELNAVEEATISNSSAIEQNKEKSDKQKDNATAKKVPFYKLFSFADSTDMALMVIGSVGAVGNGLAMPLMAILLGDLIDSFGQNQNTKHVIHVVSQMVLERYFSMFGEGTVAKQSELQEKIRNGSPQEDDDH